MTSPEGWTPNASDPQSKFQQLAKGRNNELGAAALIHGSVTRKIVLPSRRSSVYID